MVLTNHHQANDLTERYNACIKAGLRRMCMLIPGSELYDHLGEVLMGLRFLPTKLGVSPNVVTLKQEPG